MFKRRRNAMQSQWSHCCEFQKWIIFYAERTRVHGTSAKTAEEKSLAGQNLIVLWNLHRKYAMALFGLTIRPQTEENLWFFNYVMCISALKFTWSWFLKIRPRCHLSWEQNRSECTNRLILPSSSRLWIILANSLSSTKMFSSHKIWSNFADTKLIWGNQKHQKPVITAIQLTLTRLFWLRACGAAKSSSNRLNGNVFNY